MVTAQHELELAGDVSSYFALDMMSLGLVLKQKLPHRGIVKGNLHCTDRTTNQKVSLEFGVGPGYNGSD